jgi:hypothetical protein
VADRLQRRSNQQTGDRTWLGKLRPIKDHNTGEGIMADRFYGDIHIGGRVTREQFKVLCNLADPCLEMEGTIEEDGTASFQECTSEDFADLVTYCEEHKIPLMLQWDGKYEYGPFCEYWINGTYKQFDTDSNGRIVVTVEALHEQRAAMTINEFLASLELPEFPAFELVDAVVGTPDATVDTKLIEAKLVARVKAAADRLEQVESIEELKQQLEHKTTMRAVTVYFSDGDTITTDINGTNEEIAKHYLGQRFEAGSDTEHHTALCVRFHDIGESIGLRCRNIESGCVRMIRAVSVEVTAVDDNESYPWICLHVSDTQYDLDDVWVYDLNGEWIKGIGYKHATAN